MEFLLLGMAAEKSRRTVEFLREKPCAHLQVEMRGYRFEVDLAIELFENVLTYHCLLM